MVVLGLNQGTQPIIGYNYGAGNYRRVRETLFYALKMATIFTTVGFLIGQFFPQLLTSAFTSDEELLEISGTGVALGYAGTSIGGFSDCQFQLLPEHRFCYQVYRSESEPPAHLLGSWHPPVTPHLGTEGALIAIPVSDTLSALLSLYLLVIQLRHLRQMELGKGINEP